MKTLGRTRNLLCGVPEKNAYPKANQEERANWNWGAFYKTGPVVIKNTDAKKDKETPKNYSI